MKKIIKPPAAAEWILKKVPSFNNEFDMISDFRESYIFTFRDNGAFKAKLWYWHQVLFTLFEYIYFKLYWSVNMYKNYMKIALRNIKRNRGYSIINVAGLAVGIASCLLIFLFVKDELSYNNFHENRNRIFRLTDETEFPEFKIKGLSALTRFAGHIQQRFPEVENTVRIRRTGDKLFEINGKRSKEKILFADSTFFKTFTFPLIAGNEDFVLRKRFSAVVSRSFADRNFGNEDPVGKIILYEGKHNLTITGIMEDVPENSDYRFDVVASFSSLESIWGKVFHGGFSHTLFILLKEGTSPRTLENKMNNPEIIDFPVNYATEYYLQPLTAMHYDSRLNYGNFSDISRSYIFSLVAFLILIIGCINFINLSTARAVKRAKEVGIRKVIGAKKSQLFNQFILESMLLSFLSLLAALVASYLFLPFFNSLTDKGLHLNLFSDIQLLLVMLSVTIIVGLFSGSYPSMVLSSFQPEEIFKGSSRKAGVLGVMLRKGLVIFQFALSLVFIIGMIVVLKQMSFIQNTELGFEKNNLVSVSLHEDKAVAKRYDVIKSELLSHPDIIDMAASRVIPGFKDYLWMHKYQPEGFDEEDAVELGIMQVSGNYFDFYGMKMKSGRAYSMERAADPLQTVILNEAAVKKIGWENPVGKKISYYEVESRVNEETNEIDNYGFMRNRTVIGIVNDFYTGSFREKIKPTMIILKSEKCNYFTLRIRPGNTQETLAFIRMKWEKIAPDSYFEYVFNDEKIHSQYADEERTAIIFKYSAGLAIFLCCLGLLGLISFSVENRVKEIGIRKVLGASGSGILLLITREYVLYIILSIIAAWPAAYFILKNWLQNFAYRINLSPAYFFTGTILTLIIALITISFQSVKAASANPVDSIKYE